jgi:DNA-binding transcriptional regulator GbsR (MarR family)
MQILRKYFEAEKDIWKMFCIIAQERKRREIDPVQEVLMRCLDKTEGLKGNDAESFQKQMKELSDFVSTTSGIMDRVSSSKQNKFFSFAAKFFT